MAWHLVGEELCWLLTGPQLRAYLEGRGVTMRADIPASGQWRGQCLYDPKAALAYCEAQPEEWWT